MLDRYVQHHFAAPGCPSPDTFGLPQPDGQAAQARFFFQPMKYEIAGETFTSKKAVTQRARSIRELWVGQDVPPRSQDFAFVGGLLPRHAEPEKHRGGIRRLFVAWAPDHPSTCFFVERADGSKTDFGVASCLHPVRSLNLASFRELVRPYVEQFKQTALQGRSTFVSAYSGRTFPAVQGHVDHNPRTFISLVEQFCDDTGLDLDRLLTRGVDMCSRPVFDPPRAADFFNFPADHARLRLVGAKENLSDIRKSQPVAQQET